MIPGISLLIGVIFLIWYMRKNLTVIDKTDPENTQFVCDLKQLQMRLKNEK